MTRFTRIAELGIAVGLAFFAINNGAQLAAPFAGITRMAMWPASAGVGLSIAAMANRGQLNRAAYRAAGMDIGSFAMTRTSAVGFAANKVVKSGGAAGLSVFVRDGRRQGLPSGKIAASCVLVACASLAALGVLLAATVILLAVAGRLTGWWMAAAAGFSLYGLAVVAAGLLATHSRPLAVRLVCRVQRGLARVRHRRSTAALAAAPSSTSAVDALFDALAQARRRPRRTGRIIGHAIASKVLGASMLMAAAHAAGIPLSVATAVVIYATALAASFVSIVPGGVGVVEASTGAMLISNGAPVPAAVLAVAVFRILDLWLPVMAGAVIGWKDVRDPNPAVGEGDLAVFWLCAGRPPPVGWLAHPYRGRYEHRRPGSTCEQPSHRADRVESSLRHRHGVA